MKRTLWLIPMATMLMTVVPAEAKKLVKTGKEITTEGVLKVFVNIDVEDAYNVEVKAGEKYAYTMTGDEVYKYVALIEVEDGTLKIKNRERTKVKDHVPPKIVVTMPILDKAKELELEVSGASALQMAGFKGGELSLDINGASKVTLQRVDVEQLDMEMSGASVCIVDGYATQCEAEISGASSFQASDLDMKYCNIETTGASSTKIGKVSNRLKAETSGASKMVYSGEPKSRDIKTSDVSSTRRQ